MLDIEWVLVQSVCKINHIIAVWLTIEDLGKQIIKAQH